MTEIASYLSRILVFIRGTFERDRVAETDDSPYLDQASLTKQDPDENAKTAPPSDEHVVLNCMWGVEFYTPANKESLIEAMTHLGWEYQESISPRQDPVSWLRNLERYQRSQSWFNLDMIVRKDREVFPAFRAYRAPLPDSVDYARGRMISISPSLVCIVVCFIIKADTDDSAAFDQALRKEYTTYPKRVADGWRIHDPRYQKSQRVAEIRTANSVLVAEWFAENIPGLFSSGLLDGQVPTCDLITLRSAEPYPPRDSAQDLPPWYLWIMDMDSDFDCWTSKSDGVLKIKFPGRRHDDPQYHLSLASKEQSLLEATKDSGGGKSRSSAIANVNMGISSLIATWAILPLLEGYTQHINAVVNSSVARSASRSDAVRLLETLEDHVSYSSDIVAVASDLVELSSNPWPLSFDIGKFIQTNRQKPEEDIQLANVLQNAINSQSEWIRNRDSSLRSHLTQYGSLIGATENVRLQSQLRRLTWVLIVLAVVATLATVAAAVLPLCSPIMK